MLELLLMGGALAGGYQLVKAVKRRRERVRTRRITQETQERATALARWRAARADSAKRRAARDMQLGIQQLAASPDFRRAASFAARAAQAGVPAEFRQRQFRRLRPLLVEHLARRLESGAGAENAAAGLRELVGGLGVAPYEAEYIATEAQGRQQMPAQRTRDYRDRLRELHAEHSRRLDAIRDTPDLEDELREQLEEAEQERFRRELMEERDEGR